MSLIKRAALLITSLVGLVECTPPLPNGAGLLNSTSLRFLYQNNLNATDDQNHIGAILVDASSKVQAEAVCRQLSESLISRQALQNYSSDFFYLLSYVESAGYANNTGQQFWTQDGIVVADKETQGLSFLPAGYNNRTELPALCTQSDQQNGPDANATADTLVHVAAAGNTYTGFRNQKSFRFQGLRYANIPPRFTYSSVYSPTGQAVDATQYGNNCPQTDSGDEDCLFLNIQTPYLPKQGCTTRLRPVLFSIHGGGFTSGNGRGTNGQDGGNFASRDDIVSVEINYRLSTLGFLALPGTNITGNYGIGDQVTALRWVQRNIAAFGGDPEKITIIGASAGAGSVRALLGSPPVIQEKLIAGGVAQSNLGGGVTLGLEGTYGTTYSSYLTIEESAARAGQQIFQEAGCNQTSIDEQIQCLTSYPARLLSAFANVARFVVQDGYYVNTQQLIVNTRNESTAHVPIIFGVDADDGASIGSDFPGNNVTSLANGIATSLSITTDQAERVINSGLFPYYKTGNLSLDAFNVSQRVATDITFRCIDEATVYAGAQSGAFPATYYYEFDRTWRGYDPSNLGPALSSGPVEPGYPNGNPNKAYFRLHGSEGGFTYGVQAPLRDRNDLLASQLISGYFAQFTKTGDPNPDVEFLKVRGYFDALEQVEKSGRWEAVRDKTGPAKSLDVVSRSIQFPELEQCTWLNYTISYYLDGAFWDCSSRSQLDALGEVTRLIFHMTDQMLQEPGTSLLPHASDWENGDSLGSDRFLIRTTLATHPSTKMAAPMMPFTPTFPIATVPYAAVDWTLSIDKNILLLCLDEANVRNLNISAIAKAMKMGFSSAMTIPRIKERYKQLASELESHNYFLQDYPQMQRVQSADGQATWTPRSDRDLLLFAMRDRRREDMGILAMVLGDKFGKTAMTEENVGMRVQALWAEKVRMEADYDAEHMVRMREGR
ncbi:hypothetical protein CERZMDRAFT_86504 [Cercospora zeae-maydis SCOH1-5]|uniref:Carboxylesterase type B domain-containing protein n=1 Tax=Cercospora zeae-maydis SCOH1-5 TaxID=717836 RepID=A0A6A6F8X0_9PEZI|nr:hypothetical protein CERZMDRAFT_86504 [Cercospora zeae-maydis SCOH1-5]